MTEDNSKAASTEDDMLAKVTAPIAAMLQNDIVRTFNVPDEDHSLYAACLAFMLKMMMSQARGDDRHMLTGAINASRRGRLCPCR